MWQVREENHQFAVMPFKVDGQGFTIVMFVHYTFVFGEWHITVNH